METCTGRTYTLGHFVFARFGLGTSVAGAARAFQLTQAVLGGFSHESAEFSLRVWLEKSPGTGKVQSLVAAPISMSAQGVSPKTPYITPQSPPDHRQPQCKSKLRTNQDRG